MLFCAVTLLNVHESMRFKAGGDDALATLSLKDGKIGGYWIK